jgi:glycosyltransferase involved in cell wall biosynthesis
MISIIIPTRNRRECLLACLEHILRNNISMVSEVIIMDDGSATYYAGEAAELLQGKVCCKVYRNNSRLGPSACRNIAAAYATGDILAFLDDDSFVSQNWLEEVCGHIYNHKMITGKVGNAHEHKQLIPELRQIKYDIRYSPLAGACREVNFFSAGNAAILRSVFEEVNGFDQSYRIMSDNALIKKANASGIKCIYVDSLTIKHLHDGSISKAVRSAFMAGYAKARMADVSSANMVKAFRSNISRFRVYSSRMRYGKNFKRRLVAANFVLESFFLISFISGRLFVRK